MKLLRRYPGGKTHIEGRWNRRVFPACYQLNRDYRDFGAIEGAAPTCKRCLAILARREKQ